MGKNRLEKLALPLIATTILGLNLIGARLDSKAIENNGGKTMPQVQPWIWIYDDNGDNIADRTVVGIVGGYLAKYMYEREPTQEEIDWYKNN